MFVFGVFVSEPSDQQRTESLKWRTAEYNPLLASNGEKLLRLLTTSINFFLKNTGLISETTGDAVGVEAPSIIDPLSSQGSSDDVQVLGGGTKKNKPKNKNKTKNKKGKKNKNKNKIKNKTKKQKNKKIKKLKNTKKR